MKAFLSKKVVIAIIVVMVIVIGLLIVFSQYNKAPEKIIVPVQVGLVQKVIGYSVAGRALTAYTFGTGTTSVVFVGGIHGGYEWNSELLAYTLVDYLKLNPQIIPKNLSVTVIPSANPDGLYKVTGKEGTFTMADVKTNLPLGTGRFNNNEVDLNRNFACSWQATSTWQNKKVSAGTSVFSEPEARTIRDFILQVKPAAVVFFHSQSNAVYASACGNGILPGTLAIMNTYSLAAGYQAVKTFDSYVVTGAAEDWLASINIPAITVELKTHETVEWDKNLAGIKALFSIIK